MSLNSYFVQFVKNQNFNHRSIKFYFASISLFWKENIKILLQILYILLIHIKYPKEK